MGVNDQTFTWCINRSGDEQINERLDRALINKEGTEGFPTGLCINEIALGSDHTPLIM